MAENKKSFVLYADLIHTVTKMPNDKAGQLLKHILSYVNDENPETDDLIIQLTFEPIKQQLKRDLRKYEDKKKQWSEAGKRSAEARKVKKKQRTLTDVKSRSTDLTVNVNDSVNVSVNDNVIKEKENAFTFLKSHTTEKLESFIMQNKPNVNDWDMMIESYNDQIDLEVAQNKISFNVDELLPRLKKWCRSWINNQKPDTSKPKPIDNPNNEKIITFKSNINPSRMKLPESEFNSLVERMKGGGYVYTVIE